ncbi:hypothetical protein ACQP1P_03760 [Dactylosporangium sp. CA-052675]|uniref:acyl-CoA-like ligand-binding transcription factor n=1 Tax=Dactylosporangium sp. CA-052675 TaxID=3239927 RepID=UPI003D8C4432
MTVETPALLGRYLERQAAWRRTLTAEPARRMAVDPSADLRPSILVAMAFAAFDTALTRFARAG